MTQVYETICHAHGNAWLTQSEKANEERCANTGTHKVEHIALEYLTDYDDEDLANFNLEK